MRVCRHTIAPIIGHVLRGRFDQRTLDLQPASLSAGLTNGPKRMAKLRIYWQKSNKLFDWLLEGLEGSFADGMG